MLKERNRAPFASFGADTKEARKALGLSQKTFAEIIGIDPRYLANIENSGALPSLPIFYEIVRLCKLPVERYFHPEATESRDSRERERTVLKLHICPERYLSIVEGTIDAAIKLDEAGNG
jgi:transcriptional regulator with XRE-family HTH domain